MIGRNGSIYTISNLLMKYTSKKVRRILNRIFNADCNETTKQLEDNSIDLVVTSPPYNVDLGNNKYNKDGYDQHNDNLSHEDYLLFLKKVFGNIYPKLKKGGRVCINIGDGKNGAIPTHAEVIHMMTHDIGYIPMTTIVWNKNQTSNRAAWGSWMSPSSPSFPRGFEYILVFAKEQRKLSYKGETDLAKDEFIEWANGLWTFAPETKQKKIGHPAMFPIELPKRCIKMFSWKDATVYDPFMGAGTTALACIETNRNYIGSELSKEYVSIAEKRINEYKQ